MCSADRKEASQTTNTPSGNCAADAAATASASAVLPTPPGPVTVVNGVNATLSITSAISAVPPHQPTRAQRRARVAPAGPQPVHRWSRPWCSMSRSQSRKPERPWQERRDDPIGAVLRKPQPVDARSRRVSGWVGEVLEASIFRLRPGGWTRSRKRRRDSVARRSRGRSRRGPPPGRPGSGRLLARRGPGRPRRRGSR